MLEERRLRSSLGRSSLMMRPASTAEAATAGGGGGPPWLDGFGGSPLRILRKVAQCTCRGLRLSRFEIGWVFVGEMTEEEKTPTGNAGGPAS
ncbi:hypothetical protein AXF42_Ash009156 [Apostasia shenzhenica]|uniref:Uncharacterized protein n=1 Tax=Apostasia shenzhenica TaxID=1088818 RepID=A0A2I0ADN5_9ASPA|nr:hypothetical protein AXF42_Ash009156 [Apostasia shenzhenica]